MWTRRSPHSAFALSGHRGLWSGWGTEVAAAILRSKAQVDAEIQEMTDLKGGAYLRA